jgi:hypothetical protein
MTLKDMFEKPVDRPIEGVIKADDEESLKLEVDEYVLTNEVEKRLEAFLDAYRNYQGANGVWISGFFGSGKSHLLKILSLVLQNKSIEGNQALELFLPKCKDNAFLKGELNKAVSIPSKSILFNIDQKADVISKKQIDALLAVFVKVFDEMCGYYGKQGHIAQFERDLDNRGQYGEFKAAYKEISGNEWEFGREQALLEADNIAKAYQRVANVEKEAATGLLDKYRKEYKVSIEDFANQVQEYIERQGLDFRLNFFVDEVGQYIAGNTKLMTNLQTIAESLATKCRGRAWIVVTAQEDMNTVIGEVGKQQGEDFSKIQDRFSTRMKLTSADVAEVIQKRLLMKNKVGQDYLAGVYEEQSNNFKTLFDFGDGSQTYKNFQDFEHFNDSYPFVPYQFALFQAAIQNLSAHNAFEGRHSSVGERSMLGVFQQVAIQVADQEPGQLATFDLMFEGIRAALKGNIQRSVLVAEKNLDDPFAVCVLKALFLVKYVKEFKATLRNIVVLMLDRFDRDLPEFTDKVEEALNLLESQSYIQRNGTLYEFLTDEEKDVEQEIKLTDVETKDVSDRLGKIIFDGVVKSGKIRHAQSERDYAFSKKLDDRLIGREHELSIHVISPFNENVTKEETLRTQSWGKEELLILFPPDARLVQDLLMYERTEKYVRQNISITQQDTIKKILAEKSHQNQQRLTDIQTRVKALLSKAKIFVAGDEVEIKEKDPQSRIIQGFSSLVLRAYPNLRMLGDVKYSQDKIASYLDQSQDSLFKGDATVLSEPEQEMQAFIQSNRRSGTRTTLKSLVERFEKKPYGWDLGAILCVLAKLFARGKVDARQDGEIIEDANIEKALTNTHGYPKVVLDPQIDFTRSQVRRLKTFYEDFFDAPPKGQEAKDLGKETGEAIDSLLQDLTNLSRQSDSFPFLGELDQLTTEVKKLTGKPYSFYLSNIDDFEDTLLDLKESVLDPIRTFMAGPNKQLYQDARRFLKEQEANLAFIEGDDPKTIQDILDDKACFKGKGMQQVKSGIEALRATIDNQVAAEIQKAVDGISDCENRFRALKEFGNLKENEQSEFDAIFGDKKSQIKDLRLIALIREAQRRFEEDEYLKLILKMESLVKPKDTGSGEAGDSGGETGGDDVTQPKFVLAKSIRVSFDQAWLEKESDVDRYLDEMKKAFMEQIANGKRVQV